MKTNEMHEINKVETAIVNEITEIQEIAVSDDKSQQTCGSFNL